MSVDGAISQFGPIAGDQIFQAKGHSYSTQALVGGDARWRQSFQDGAFATLYLSPKDYHRIHMPCDGTLRQMIYVPGDLFSVNPATRARCRVVRAQRARGVRVRHAQARLVVVLVGRPSLAAWQRRWHGVVNPPACQT